MRKSLALAASVLLAVPLAACGDDGGRDRTTLTVFAAASLTTTFEELVQTFEADHPDVDVRLSFGGSSDLVAQIEEGASADVFASADQPTMDRLIASHATGPDPVEFATNVLVAVTAPGNPLHLRTVEDLTDPDVDLVLCAPEVPCGRASQQVADQQQVTFEPVSEEQSVTDVLAKVQAGEADAGLVYVTDARAAGDDVESVAMPGLDRVVNHYPIVMMDDTDEVRLAREFIDLVVSTTGQRILAGAGFGPPSA